MIIIVTGTPGSGKTTLAKGLAKEMKFEYVDVTALILEKKLSDGKDAKRDCLVVDVKNLKRALVELIRNAKKSKKSLVIDSHMSHYLAARYVDQCIVCKCELKTLSRRLKKRGYSADKIRENLDCEIFEVCLTEARDAGHKILEVDCTKKVKLKDICDSIAS